MLEPTPRSPSPGPEEAVLAGEQRLDVARLVEAGVAGAVAESFRFPPTDAVASVSGES